MEDAAGDGADWLISSSEDQIRLGSIGTSGSFKRRYNSSSLFEYSSSDIPAS